MKDDIFLKNREKSTFSFNHEVVSVFDDMISRSVPFYDEVNNMITEAVKNFHNSNTNIYDLGCSTGILLEKIASVTDFPRVKIYGFDNSEEMLGKARIRTSRFQNINLKKRDLTEDLELNNAGTVILAYTLQFISPSSREKVLKKIFKQLPAGGMIILAEKNIADREKVAEFFINEYHRYKSEMGYSVAEIENKRKALENVLIPFTIKQNKELLINSGASSVHSFFQWYNFSGLIAFK